MNFISLIFVLCCSLVFAGWDAERERLEDTVYELQIAGKCETGESLKRKSDCEKAAQALGFPIKNLPRSLWTRRPSGCYAYVSKGNKVVVYNKYTLSEVDATENWALLCETGTATTTTTMATEKPEKYDYGDCVEGVEVAEIRQCRDFCKCKGKVVDSLYRSQHCKRFAPDMICTQSKCCTNEDVDPAQKEEAWKPYVDPAQKEEDANEDFACPSERITYNKNYEEVCCEPGQIAQMDGTCGAATATKSLRAVNRALKEALKAALN